MKLKLIVAVAVATIVSGLSASAQLMNQAKDMSPQFNDFSATYFFAESLTSFDVASGDGLVKWDRYSIEPRQAFNLNSVVMDRLPMKDFPESGYVNDPELRIKLDFVSPRTVRIRMLTSPIEPMPVEELMLAGEPPVDRSWVASETADAVTYTSAKGSITIEKKPWRIVLRDADGNDVTQVKVKPFGFVKSGLDNSRHIAPIFSIKPGERIYGCGESPTSLNKVGQTVKLYVTDPQGPETDEMYKPVPFWFSNRGYGIFLHTSAPVTCDLGATYVGAQKIYMGDEQLDMFLFIGEPKDILDEYTSLVGKAQMPPLWSFGTWMSRITYFSQEDGYDVARNVRTASRRMSSTSTPAGSAWTGSATTSSPPTASPTPRR